MSWIEKINQEQEKSSLKVELILFSILIAWICFYFLGCAEEQKRNCKNKFTVRECWQVNYDPDLCVCDYDYDADTGTWVPSKHGHEDEGEDRD